MKRLYIVLIFFGVVLNTTAQNLVPNGGFDTFTSCPGVQNRLYLAFPWYNPSTSTPDFYHTCGPTGASMAIPANLTGYQYGHSPGGGYAGCGVFLASNTTPNSREYAQVELTDTLLDSSYYCVSFYVSKANNAPISISDIGLYLSDTAYFLTINTFMPVQPQIFNPDTNIISDTLNWTEISGIYQAHGGERFITIGNFRDSANSHAVLTDTNAWNLNARYSYYLIDDVSIINCDSLFTNVNEVNLNAVISLFPNPASQELNIQFKDYSLEDVEVRIFDMLGREQFFNRYGWAKKVSIDVDELSEGAYLVEVRSRNSIVCRKFLKE